MNLLPCPLCGSSAELDSRQGFLTMPSGKLSEAVAIYCTSDNGENCSCDVRVCRDDVPDMSREDCIAMVAEIWNRRVVPMTTRAVTGRTIADLTNREHVCEWQHAVKINRHQSATQTPDMAVPRKATEEMLWAGCPEGKNCKRCPAFVDTVYGPGVHGCRALTEETWDLMIAAAPPHPTTQASRERQG